METELSKGISELETYNQELKEKKESLHIEDVGGERMRIEIS